MEYVQYFALQFRPIEHIKEIIEIGIWKRDKQ